MHANIGGIAAGPITPDGRVTMFRKGLTAGVGPSEIDVGADGNFWFIFDGGITAAGSGVARVAPRGKVTDFFEPPDLQGVPFELVLGPDRNVWFDHAAVLSPTGEIAEFSAGLAETAGVTHPVAGPDGNVWFGDDSDPPAIDRITRHGV